MVDDKPVFYPLEVEAELNICYDDDLKNYDYINVMKNREDLTQINEYVLENQSGVFNTLESLPGYYEYVPDAVEDKMNALYYLYTQPAIEYTYETCKIPFN